MRSVAFTFASAMLVSTAVSVPTPVEPEVAERAAFAVPSKITSEAQMNDIISGLETDAKALAQAATIIVDIVGAVVPSPAPASIPEAIASVASVYAPHPTDFIASGFDLLVNGLAPIDAIELALSQSPLENSSKNINLRPAVPAVYPKKSQQDAPYSLPESTLRSAIYIPFDYTYGRVPPVILIPSTGGTAGQQFGGNFGKIFRGSNYADPVFLNIPGNQLNDIQVNSEYVAYAINYISAISGHKNVSTLSWSAGSVDGQWAMNYWPSTRKVVSDVIKISGDLHGTVLAYALCPGFPQIPCAPAILQQTYNSTFIRTLRNGGGDAAYVPTTSVYSAFDEIVQPQQDDKASAFVLDRRNVGVTNVEIQNACTVFQPGGTLYLHEGVLYNALAVALAKDALTHPGPGDLRRINVAAECQRIAAEQLGLPDVLATEAAIFIAAANTIAYPNKVTEEPPIKAYAQKDTPAN